MRETTDMQDMKDGVRAFSNGRRAVRLDAQFIETVGLREALQRAGISDSKKLLPVYQRGHHVGSLPELWDWQTHKGSLMYRPRATDFVRNGDAWEADPLLGPGDLLHAGVSFNGDMPKPDW